MKSDNAYLTQVSHLSRLDFSRDIKRLTEGFRGRSWIFKEIEDWLLTQDQVFILTGEPGIGKSAIAAQLTQIRSDIIAYHFCIAGRNETIEPNRVLRSLAAQLIDYLPGYAEAFVNTVNPLRLSINVEITVESIKDSNVQAVVINNLHTQSPQEALSIILQQSPIALLNPPKQPRLILIDSLDEAVTLGDRNLVTLIAGIGDIPSWMRLLLTSRPENRVLMEFEPLKPHSIDKISTQNLDDIREYVQGRVAQPKLQDKIFKASFTSQTLVNEIIKISSGNFLYTKLLLNEIEAGRQPLDDLSALPKSIDDIYFSFLRRFKPEEWRNRYQPILGTLAITQEPVTEKQLRFFTHISPTTLRQDLGVTRQFFDVFENDHGDLTYAIFHQSLRDYLLDEDRNKYFGCNAQEQHEKIASYYLSKSPSKWNQDTVFYGFKHIFTHLKLAGKLDELINLLSDFDFISGKVKFLGAEAILEDLYTGYRLLISEFEGLESQSKTSQLIQALFEYLLKISPADNNKFNIEHIHAALIYRSDQTFYEKFLELGTTEKLVLTLSYQVDRPSSKISNIVTACQARLANLKRRKGELQQAELLLQSISKNLESSSEQDPKTFKEMARVKYDLGYIQWLRGLVNSSVESLHQSSVLSKKAEDLVGQWISLCVEYYVRFYSGLSSVKEFKDVLEQALSNFQEEAVRSGDAPNAVRWIMNANAHLFMLAYLDCDLSSAEKYLVALRKDPWVIKYQNDQPFLKPYLARFAILKQNWSEAIDCFREYLDEIQRKQGSEKMSKQESISRDYYDYGLALQKSGDYTAAQHIWQDALKLPDEPGNHVWKRQIREALQRF